MLQKNCLKQILSLAQYKENDQLKNRSKSENAH